MNSRRVVGGIPIPPPLARKRTVPSKTNQQSIRHANNSTLTPLSQVSYESYDALWFTHISYPPSGPGAGKEKEICKIAIKHSPNPDCICIRITYFSSTLQHRHWFQANQQPLHRRRKFNICIPTHTQQNETDQVHTRTNGYCACNSTVQTNLEMNFVPHLRSHRNATTWDNLQRTASRISCTLAGVQSFVLDIYCGEIRG